MSCRVLIIPEDPTLNGYILRPLVSKLLAACGKTNAKVSVLSNPKVSGVEHAIGKLPEIVDAYRHFELMLFLPDGDGKDRSQHFSELENKFGPKFLCCAAVEEVETWLLAGHVDRLSRPWNQVRADASIKENEFFPFLREFGDSRRPGGGREELMQVTLSNLSGLFTRCPELATLRDRMCAALS